MKAMGLSVLACLSLVALMGCQQGQSAPTGADSMGDYLQKNSPETPASAAESEKPTGGEAPQSVRGGR